MTDTYQVRTGTSRLFPSVRIKVVVHGASSGVDAPELALVFRNGETPAEQSELIAAEVARYVSLLPAAPSIDVSADVLGQHTLA